MLSIKCTGGPRTLMGKLFLVDLAGSERVKKSGVEGAAFDEAKAINLSLTTLGRCIEILASGKKERPPFRDSKLTRLLSNAIGGNAKTTLIVCVAPTVSDQFETVNSLEFGLQAMNVVVKAKVNASTDYNSLVSSLMTQRDLKQKPLRELECKVLQELTPQLDEVVELEKACKEVALQISLAEEQMEAEKARAKELKAEGKRMEEEDKKAMAALSEKRSAMAVELEQVLMKLSDNPEMAQIQSEHEAEKTAVAARSEELQEALNSAELRSRHERESLEAALDGAIHTARNLGQIAAYFFQTGASNEAADFYMQAKSIFDATLGPEHPKTQQWQQDLFFLINAPAIQQITSAAANETGATDGTTAQEWWMQNLNDLNIRSAPTAAGGNEEEETQGWWMQVTATGTTSGLAPPRYHTPCSRSHRPQVADCPLGPAPHGDAHLHPATRRYPPSPPSPQNLFDMKTRDAGGGDPDDAVSYLSTIFATPRGDQVQHAPRASRASHAIPRGPGVLAASPPTAVPSALQAIFTPRGTLNPALSGGLPPVATKQDIGFTSDWVQRVFEGGDVNADGMDAQMTEAAEWLMVTFGTPRGTQVPPPTTLPKPSATPRNTTAGQQSDDAVLAAAMQAVLATPRGTSHAVDDKPMAGAFNKMFKQQV